MVVKYLMCRAAIGSCLFKECRKTLCWVRNEITKTDSLSVQVTACTNPEKASYSLGTDKFVFRCSGCDLCFCGLLPNQLKYICYGVRIKSSLGACHCL